MDVLLSTRAGGATTASFFNNNNNDSSGDRLPAGALSNLQDTVTAILRVVISISQALLPPTVATAKAVVYLYQVLPKDALLALTGLVTCFLGGTYPTLFATLQAAQHCGWPIVVAAVQDLTDEAVLAVQAVMAVEQQQEQPPNAGSSGTSFASFSSSSSSFNPQKASTASTSSSFVSAKDLLVRQTLVVLATVDPVKINQAVGALYTTWMGIETVLEQEFAKTIALSLTLADGLQPVAQSLVAPALYWTIPVDYHQWVPILTGWLCKALAMSVAWRLQRIVSASSSAVAGGLLFSRALFRLLFRSFQRHATKKKDSKQQPKRARPWQRGRNRRSAAQRRQDEVLQQLQRRRRAAAAAAAQGGLVGLAGDDNEEDADVDGEPELQNSSDEETATASKEQQIEASIYVDEILGFLMAGWGFYFQMQHGFKVNIPFPINLLTWPLDVAEHWIQWHITKRVDNNNKNNSNK